MSRQYMKKQLQDAIATDSQESGEIMLGGAVQIRRLEERLAQYDKAHAEQAALLQLADQTLSQVRAMREAQLKHQRTRSVHDLVDAKLLEAQVDAALEQMDDCMHHKIFT